MPNYPDTFFTLIHSFSMAAESGSFQDKSCNQNCWSRILILVMQGDSHPKGSNSFEASDRSCHFTACDVEGSLTNFLSTTNVFPKLSLSLHQLWVGPCLLSAMYSTSSGTFYDPQIQRRWGLPRFRYLSNFLPGVRSRHQIVFVKSW